MTAFDTTRFEELKERFQDEKIERESLKRKLKELKASRKFLAQKAEDAESARIIHQKVSKRTLANLEVHFSDPITIAISSVFPDEIEFVTRAENRRNQTEFDLLFREDGREQPPVGSAGRGACDVAAFALRPTYWTLDKNRAVFILDEPFPYVSPDLQWKVSEMLTMVSTKLGIQIIMVSHADEINFAADKTFITWKEGKYSKTAEDI